MIVTIVLAVLVGLPAMLTVGVFMLGQFLRAFGNPQDVPASEAGCLPDRAVTATVGDRMHAPVGEKVEYAVSPPAFGRHWANALQGYEVKRFYSVEDRPPVERLVHSLEHGYTILWYDLSVTAAAREAASEVVGPKFIAAPWTASDGAPLDPQIHAVLVHWSVGGGGDTTPATLTGEPGQEVGVWRSCAEVSGEVIDDFMADYPYTDSREPSGP